MVSYYLKFFTEAIGKIAKMTVGKKKTTRYKVEEMIRHRICKPNVSYQLDAKILL